MSPNKRTRLTWAKGVYALVIALVASSGKSVGENGIIRGNE